jgi:acyl carrier protein
MTASSQIRNYILENFLFTTDSDTFLNDASLLDQGLIDSTGILELVYFVEETFGIKIADKEMVPDNFDSVDNIARFVQQKQQAA